MPTNPDKQQDSQPEEGMEKYGVSCKCAHGDRPKDEEMTKLADGSFECPACGRKHPGEKE